MKPVNKVFHATGIDISASGYYTTFRYPSWEEGYCAGDFIFNLKKKKIVVQKCQCDTCARHIGFNLQGEKRIPICEECSCTNKALSYECKNCICGKNKCEFYKERGLS